MTDRIEGPDLSADSFGGHSRPRRRKVTGQPRTWAPMNCTLDESGEASRTRCDRHIGTYRERSGRNRERLAELLIVAGIAETGRGSQKEAKKMPILNDIMGTSVKGRCSGQGRTEGQLEMRQGGKLRSALARCHRAFESAWLPVKRTRQGGSCACWTPRGAPRRVFARKHHLHT